MKTPKKKHQMFAVYFEPADLARIRMLAVEEQRSTSGLIRFAVLSYVNAAEARAKSSGQLTETVG